MTLAKGTTAPWTHLTNHVIFITKSLVLVQNNQQGRLLSSRDIQTAHVDAYKPTSTEAKLYQQAYHYYYYTERQNILLSTKTNISVWLALHVRSIVGRYL